MFIKYILQNKFLYSIYFNFLIIDDNSNSKIYFKNFENFVLYNANAFFSKFLVLDFSILNKTVDFADVNFFKKNDSLSKFLIFDKVFKKSLSKIDDFFNFLLISNQNQNQKFFSRKFERFWKFEYFYYSKLFFYCVKQNFNFFLKFLQLLF